MSIDSYISFYIICVVVYNFCTHIYPRFVFLPFDKKGVFPKQEFITQSLFKSMKRSSVRAGEVVIVSYFYHGKEVL